MPYANIKFKPNYNTLILFLRRLYRTAWRPFLEDSMDPNSELGKECLGQASLSGLKAAIQASVVSGALYLAAMKYSPFFRNVFSVSARTALTVMPIFYTGYLKMELTMHKCMQDAKPEYVSIQDDDEDTLHHRRR